MIIPVKYVGILNILLLVVVFFVLVNMTLELCFEMMLRICGKSIIRKNLEISVRCVCAVSGTVAKSSYFQKCRDFFAKF
jgi:hypothetical protein